MRSTARSLSNLAKSIPLRRVLVVPFILQISLAVGLIGWLSIRNGQEAVNEVAVQLRGEITARIQQYLQTYVETPHKINQQNANAVRLGQLDVQNLAALEQHLWYQLKTYETVTAIYVGSEYQEHVAVERDENDRFQVKLSGETTDHEIRIYAADRPGNYTKLLRSRPNYDPRTRPWYQAAVKSKTANWSGIYRLFATPKYVLNASQPIYDNRGALLGVAAVDFSLTDISEFLRSLKIGRSGETFILERRTGLLVGSSATQQPYVIKNPNAPLAKQDPVRVQATESSDALTRRTAAYLQQQFGKLAQIAQPQQLDFDLDGQRQFLQVAPLKNEQGLDWLIVVVVPERDFMDQIQANTRTTIVLCLAAFGLATALGILTARWITQPILRLGSAAKAIAAGDMDQTVNVQSTAELNGLAGSFNLMAAKLRSSWEDLERTNEELESRVEKRTTELGEKNAQLQQEIRDRQKVEAALKSSEEELRLLFAAMTDTVLVFDATGRCLKYIQTQSVTDNPGLDLVGKTVYEFLPATIADRIVDAIHQALQLRDRPDSGDMGNHIVVEDRLLVDYRETWFSASISPLSDQAVLWVARDITKLKRTEAALTQAKEAADAANLAKSQFLSNMSHELRTPLNIVLGFTQLMLRNRSLNAQQQDYLDTINRSGEDLLTLLNDVLEMSKIEAGRVTLNETNFDLYELLSRLQQMFYLKAQSKGLQLIFDRAATVPQFVCTDESKLRQVLVNLIGNAIKFTRSGSVALYVEASPAADLTLLDFSVEDTGCGIAESDLDRLFEPFVQTEAGQQAQEGTGLGLPISQRFVQLMGGDLTVTSTIGEGSTFWFNIPVRAVIPAALPTPTIDREVIRLAAGQPNYRILIVEDKAANRRLLVELLTSVGFDVQEAENGQVAIEQWQRWRPDLIWMDIRMPVMNGFEATRRIKSAEQSAPVIIAITGSAFEEDRLAALSVGFDDFVRKPFRTNLIFEKMAEHLGVHYVYADEADTDTKPASLLTIADLDTMSIEWITQLHEAAMRVNARQILKLVEQVPQSQAHLIRALTELVDQFRFEEIISLTAQRVEHKVSSTSA